MSNKLLVDVGKTIFRYFYRRGAKNLQYYFRISVKFNKSATEVIVIPRNTWTELLLDGVAIQEVENSFKDFPNLALWETSNAKH